MTIRGYRLIYHDSEGLMLSATRYELYFKE